MYQDIKYPSSKLGFTLVELVVAVGIIALIGIVAVQSLFDIVSIRSTQQAIEDSSDSLRLLTRTITKSIVAAQSIAIINNHELSVVGSDSCQTFRYLNDQKVVMRAEDPNYPCTPPTTGFKTITPSELAITNFSFTPIGDSVSVVTVAVEGYYKNSLAKHPIKYQSTATPRN